MGPVYLFVLVATVTLESGRVSWQTLGYHATAAECQTALLATERQIDRSDVRLDCRPIKAAP